MKTLFAHTKLIAANHIYKSGESMKLSLIALITGLMVMGTVGRDGLKPSCEEVWDSKHGHKDELEVFKYPTKNESMANVHCIPTNMYRFSQDSVNWETTSDKPLVNVTAKFAEHGFYDKADMPDVIQWSDNVLVSIDNR